MAEKEAGQTVAAKATVPTKKQNRAHLHPAGDVAIVIRESEQNERKWCKLSTVVPDCETGTVWPLSKLLFSGRGT